MTGDGDAGAFGTYAQAGQNDGTASLWLLISRIAVVGAVGRVIDKVTLLALP